ncbi:kelch repeat protein, partial [Ostertagia ostertagi]
MSDFFYAGKEKLNSSECNHGVNLMKFRELPIGPLSKGNEPAPRSGHRIFLDDEFLYVVGGFDRTADEQGEGEKLATYGHAMLRGSDPCSFYVIGGTTGHNFFLDVDKLTFANGKWRWSSEAQATPNMEGRYRLEAVLHDDLIFLFGGGRPDYVTELRTITVFDTKKKVFVDLPTLPDESIGSANWEDGYPKGRRCHSVTKWKRKAILVGGCSADKDDDDVRHVDMYSDVWSFDLDTYQWKRMPFDLATP